MPLAVLGLGSIGLRHAGNLLNSGNAVVGFDPDPGRRQALVDLGGSAVAERADAIAGADAVIIASPSFCHLDDLGAAVECGLHVLIEKPLAHTGAGIAELLRKAEDKNLLVSVGLNLRFHPAVRRAKELLDENALGQLLWARFISSSYLPDWRPGQDHRKGYAADPATGGVLFDIIHEFDLAAYLIGPAETATAVARNTGSIDIPAEDCADVVLRHDNGTLSSLHLDFVTRPARRLAEIAGTQGFLKLDLQGFQLSFFGVDGVLREETSFPGNFADTYVAEMRAFLDTVTKGVPPVCSGWEGLSVLRQVLDARKLCGLPTE